MNYNISGEPLNELRASTKDNPSGIFFQGRIKKPLGVHSRILPNWS